MPLIDQTSIEREQQLFFINSDQVPGVQNLSVGYDQNVNFVEFIGQSSTQSYVPRGAQVGKMSLSTILVSDDLIYPLLNSSSFNGYLLKSENNWGTNVFFDNAYLTNYSQTYALGQQPIINSEAIVFGNIGKIAFLDLQPQQILDLITINQTASSLILKPASLGCFNGYYFDFLQGDRVLSYSLNINATRNPIYSLGSRAPSYVKLVKPFDITFSLRIELVNFDAIRMNSFPGNDFVQTISFALKDENNVVIDQYTFQDMVLVSHNYVAGVDASVYLDMTFKTQYFDNL